MHDRVRFTVPQPTEWKRITDQIDAEMIVTRADFILIHGNAPRLAASVWLDSQPWHLSDVPILIDPECKKIETLSACAGVHKNLVPLPASQSKRSLTLF